MNFVYTGSLQGAQTPEPLFRAVKALVTKHLVDPDRILFRFVGRFSKDIQKLFLSMSSLVPIEVIPHVPHERALSYQAGADVLLLLVTSDTQGVGNEILTGKVFEYMASKKPILAITVPGPLIDLVETGRFGVVADFRDPAAIESAFLTLYNTWLEKGMVELSPRQDALNGFSRRTQAGKLAAIIREVVDQTRVGEERAP